MVSEASDGDPRPHDDPSGSEVGRRLLERIVAAPSDDELRLVYADHLLERGDTRGELIQLQLRPSPTRSDSDRITQLKASYESKWLGPVVRVTSDRVWSRGFLTECTLGARKKQDFRAAMNHEAWALVTTIRLPPEQTRGSAAEPLRPMMDLLRHPGMRSLRAIKAMRMSVARELFVEHQPAELADVESLEIEYHAALAGMLREALAGDGLPKLRELALVGNDHDRDDFYLLSSKVVRRLDVLSLWQSNARLMQWIEHLAIPDHRLREVNIAWMHWYPKPDGWTVTLRPDETGAWSTILVRGSVDRAPRFARQLGVRLLELPADTLTRFELRLNGDARAYLPYFREIERGLRAQSRLDDPKGVLVPYDRDLAFQANNNATFYEDDY